MSSPLTFQDQQHGIYLRLMIMEDHMALLNLRLANRLSHQAYEPKYEEDFYTPEGQQQLIQRRMKEADLDQAYMFGVFTLDHQLIGQITLSNIVRGAGQFADIGYFMDSRSQGKGYMTAATKIVIQFAFRSLGLHRLQAGILPHNISSQRVLEKCGFQPEGIARQLVKINNEWQDHQMYSLLVQDVYPN